MPMLVSKRMTRDPATITAQEYLSNAQLKMRQGNFQRLPVLEAGKVVGIITDRDLRAHTGFLERTKVGAVMTDKVITIAPRVTLEKAAQLMLSHKIGGLPVTEEGKLLGIITRSDILQAFLDMMGASEQGSSRIDFVIGKDHELSFAAKTIADAGAEVLGVGTYKEKWEDDRVCYAHVRGQDPHHLADVLKQNGYNIVGVHV
jgi:acetoin utilization protein AcuB